MIQSTTYLKRLIAQDKHTIQIDLDTNFIWLIIIPNNMKSNENSK